MGGYKLPKKFTKIHDVFSKASVADATLSNNPAYYVPQVSLVTRGQLIFIYESEGCIITATDTGVTCERDTGIVTVYVPRETFLFTVRVTGTSRDTDEDDFSMKVKVIYTYSGPDNAMIEGMEPVGLTVWDYSLVNSVGEGPSETYFASKVDKIWQCTLTDTGVDSQIELEVKVEDMNYDNWKIDIGF